MSVIPIPSFMSGSNSRIDHLGIAVKSIDQALEFYRDLSLRKDHTDWLLPSVPEARANFLIVHPADRSTLDHTSWKLIDSDPISGANLYQRTEPPASQSTANSVKF